MNEDEEYARLNNVLEELKEVIVSINSFTPEVIKRVFKKYPISCINLVKNNLLYITINCRL
ncbi:hypothetical protein [Rickettsia koreansis]|uniref:hypothetical protein n=1 Tax=Rickettsia koreansis TaxID=2358204 RepID=UPI003978AB95